MSKKYYWILIVLTIIYLFFSFVVSPDKAILNRYHIDATQSRLLSLTIAIPLLAIWFAAFYGLIRVNKYATKIKGSPDGEGFRYLVVGLISLGFSLPVSSTTTSFFNYLVRDHMLTQATATIISTHLNPIFQLVGFVFLFIGSRYLFNKLKKPKLPQRYVIGVGIVLLLIGIVYIIATLSNASRNAVIAPATVATYYMPDWLIVSTIVLPYMLAWGFGFYTTLLLYLYRKNVGGTLYKKALIRLNTGFFMVILSSISVQFWTAASTSIAKLGLAGLLPLIYVLLVVIAVGYVYIALGAKELAKIEEAM